MYHTNIVTGKVIEYRGDRVVTLHGDTVSTFHLDYYVMKNEVLPLAAVEETGAEALEAAGVAPGYPPVNRKDWRELVQRFTVWRKSAHRAH